MLEASNSRPTRVYWTVQDLLPEAQMRSQQFTLVGAREVKRPKKWAIFYGLHIR